MFNTVLRIKCESKIENLMEDKKEGIIVIRLGKDKILKG